MSNFFGTPISDLFAGGSGNDSIQGAGSGDTLDGGDGDDAIYGNSPVTTVQAETDILSGGAGNDWLIGGEGSDSLFGGDGDDHLIRGSGRTDGRLQVLSAIASPPASFDAMLGGAGTDTAYFLFAPAAGNPGIVADIRNPGTTTAVLFGGVPIAELNGIERLIISGGGHDSSVFGGDFADQIAILSGTVSAGGGNDTISVGATQGLGVSIVDGGDGTDLLFITASATADYTFTLLASGTSVLTSNGSNLVNATNFETLSIITGAGNDTLTGGAGNDSLNAGTGNNILDGGAGVDIGRVSFENLAASIVFDNSNSSATNVFLAGGVASGSFTNIENIIVRGGTGSDTITGSAGVDIIAGGPGDDVLNGGAGTSDRVSYLSDGAVTVSLETAGSQNTGGAGSDTVVNFEGIIGSLNADSLTGNGEANTISGEAGNDTIFGLGGNDILYAGVTDALSLGHGIGDFSTLNTLNGGDGEDTLYGASGTDALVGGNGADILRGGDSADTLWGGNDNDSLDGGEGNDSLHGEGGVDEARYFNAVAGVTVSLALQGGAQNTSGSGLDTLTGIENLSGTFFDDALTGDGGANALVGNEGDDLLEGGAGADVLDGGSGSDTASYASSGSAVFIELGGGSVAGGDAQGDSYVSIENLTGSSFHDVLQGDVQANILAGGSGIDNLYGQGGADTLRGDAGDDYLYIDEQDLSGGEVRGGSGYDWVLNYTSGPVSALLAINMATLEAEGYYGGAGNEQVNAAGVATSVTIYGNGGADQLTGGSGDDYIYFDAADLAGGSIAGGSGYDWAYLNEHVAVSLNLAATGFEGGYGRNGNDTFNASGSVTSVTLYGNGGSDTLTGGSGDDYIYFDALDLSGGSITGGAGYDWAYLNEHVAVSLNLAARGFEGGYGRDGADTFDASGMASSVTLYGNGGADTLIGGSGGDYIYFDAADLASGAIAGGAGYDYAIFNVLGVGTSLNLTATGFEGAVGRNGDDVFTAAGTAGSVSLYGYEGNDTLTGGSGSDYLYGDIGNDTLTGGAGTDYFITYTGWGQDTLTDFQQGADRVVMTVAGLTAFSQLTVSQDGADALVSYNGNSLRFSNTSAASIDVSDFINLANALSAEDPQMLVAAKDSQPAALVLPDLADDTDAGLTMESAFSREDSAEALPAGGDFPQAWREAWPETFWSDAADLGHAFKTEWPPWTIGG